jgi:hypothetical protein
MSSPPSPQSVLLQEERRRFIEKHWLRGPWLRICSLSSAPDRISFYCALIPRKNETQFFKDVGWDFSVGDGGPTISETFSSGRRSKITYERFGGKSGIEPLILYRNYHNNWPTHLELSQEFCLFLNLFYDAKKNAYFACNLNGDIEEVAHIDGLNCEVKLAFILKYLAAKQMHLGLFFDGIASTRETLQQIGLTEQEVKEVQENLSYILVVSKDKFSLGERKAFSRLLGKALIRCPKRATQTASAERKKERFCDFIIGSDTKGEPVRHTCDHEKLANYFGKNPKAPRYLTPVHFRREVLQKYYDNPQKYSVEDGLVRCGGLWLLRLDNDLPDRIIVWLGDLGRDLAEEERLHWQHHNVIPEGGISRTSHTRNIQGDFADPLMPDLVFKHCYPQIIEKWEKQFGWPIFLPLRGEDEHVFQMLRVPLADNRSEFDGQTLYLAKVLVDSLNEEALVRELPPTGKKDEKGISKLVRWFEHKKIKGFEPHIQFLRSLQHLRAGTAHRKGDKYERAAKAFRLTERDLPTVGMDIFSLSIDLLKFLEGIAVGSLT